jgi:hypothetical protein
MKLKTLVGVCLIAFAGSMITVIVAGSVVPKLTGGQIGDGGAQVATTLDANGQVVPTGDVGTTGSSGSGASGGNVSGGSGSSGSGGSSNGSTSGSSSSKSTSPSGAGGSSPTPSPSPSPGGSPSPSPTPSPSPSPTPGPTPAPTPPPPTPPPTPSCGSAGGTCSAAQVASHNAQSNCWVIYNGSYYIVTAYVNAHPGGRSVFNSSTCGHDITAYLNGSASTAGQQHGHGGSAYSSLASYRVGPVG